VTLFLSGNEAKFREDLLNIARTTLGSKILSQHKEKFAKLAVDAVLRLKGSGNLDAIQIIKKSGASLADSFLDEGKYSASSHELPPDHLLLDSAPNIGPLIS
jgi:chaperonin GroEL (HSP60 family)